MKNYSTEQIVRTVLSPVRLARYSGLANAYASHHVSIFSGKSKSASTTFRDNGYRMELGVNPIIKDDDKLLTSERFKILADYYTGLFYHEFGHVLYTDIYYILKYLEPLRNKNTNRATKIHNFIISISNILEDKFIEDQMSHYFKASEYFLTNNQKKLEEIERPDILEEYKELDPTKFDDLESLIYIYSKHFDLFEQTDYYKENKEFFDNASHLMMTTLDIRTRHNRQFAFAYELLKKIQNDKDEPDLDEQENNANNPSGMMNDLKKMSGESGDGIDKAGSSKLDEMLEEMIEKFEDGYVKEDVDKTKDRIFNDKEYIDMEHAPVNNSTPSTEDGKFLERMSNYKTEKVIEKYINKSNNLEYLEFIKDNSQYVTQIMKVVQRIRGMSQGNVQHNCKTGKFDRKSACKQYPTLTPFKKNIAPRRLPDLVFHLVVDGSGSMSGRKEYDAAKAMIIFSAALDKLGIPYAIEYFNDNYHEIERVKVKDYNDKEEYKKRLAYIYNNGGWCDSGNIDEINICHVGEELKARKEKDKFLVVFSDGYTCGSEKDLHNLIVDYTKQGLHPIGIGLGDDTVCGIYPTSIHLKTGDYQGLVNFLRECLLKPFIDSVK